ncbi:MAG TPA: hypothetical protein VNC18_07945 [Gemmatimonadaceae bacterium]|jgi:hypothetical protein|nr:hypothetical protein [Gemmatimonadaceae bacterium]
MTKFLATAAMIVIAARAATAQTAQLSAAKAAAQKAVNAENAHTAAMQQPERAMAGPAAAPAKSSPSQSSQSSQPSQRVASRGPQAGAAAVHSASESSAAPNDTSTAPIVIMREQYGYGRDGRRDPFYSLISTSELRPTMSDLRLTGILFDQGGGRSVATLRDVTTDQQYRVSTGTQLGRMRVSSIRLKSIVFTIDEFGATRQDSLILGDTTQVRKR